MAGVILRNKKRILSHGLTRINTEIKEHYHRLFPLCFAFIRVNPCSSVAKKDLSGTVATQRLPEIESAA